MPRKYQSHPCPTCSTITNNYKYCSLKCCDRHKKTYYCKACSKISHIGYSNRKKYCSECNPIHNKSLRDWSKTTIEQHFNNLPNFQANSRIRALARSIYKKSSKPKSCFNCGYSKFYEVCHIKPISSFDRSTSIAIVNDIDNLIALCPNCHWELDHKLLICE
jgi:hypothetical protein